MVLIAFALTASLQQPVSPSVPPAAFDCAGPEYRQFDFWVGEWDVVPNPRTAPPPKGSPPPREPALNVVTKTQGGCVVLETWDDRHGGTGQSFNIYDRVTKEWHQIWVSNTGGLHFYRGGLQDGRMVYLGEVPLGPAMRVQGRRTVRLSFEPLGPDTVRQFSETLNSDGTWSVNYDLVYTRRGRPGSAPRPEGR